MFTRALAGGDAQVSQHRLLGHVTDLVETGRIRSTATKVLRPVNAQQLREAHRLVETGRTIGKVVVTN
jgi:NADPH2:quinone reductase